MLYRKTVTMMCFLMLAATLPAEDWPQWRGKNRDAVLHESGLMESLPDGSLPRRWSVPVGPGYSGPTVADGRVYVTDRGPQDSEEDIERFLGDVS